MAHACNPSYPGGRDQKDCSSRTAQANKILSQKHPTHTHTHTHTTGRVAQVVQVVDCLPSKHEALSSNATAVKKFNLKFLIDIKAKQTSKDLDGTTL
jgi:hypothetical protein